MPDRSTESPTKRPPQAWLMVLWLVCTLVVIAFSLFAYLVGMSYPPYE